MATGVLLYPLFSEYELTVALSVLKQGNHPITTIGITDRPIQGESDLTCVADKTIYNVDASTIDSLLLPGCMDISTLFENADVIRFLQKFTEKDLVIASISSSPYLLAKAGLLKGKRYTIGMLPEHRAQTGVFDEELYSEELVVQDGNLLTARGRGFIEFGLRLGDMLKLTYDPRWYASDS
ncbi:MULTISPECIES: DJ-1/PfpI family protein [Bacillales]|uniref:DJ-1/PfpI family protein n=1 Tax=Bacillales TaxID=1385 RepID=UPI0006A7B948|nr:MULTISPECIES: DJ-1/PfpI family protein [Bacillales]OBZ12949.1 4-methyl-5(B-hydroxyethyl)-thiazole monophosphate biosynthesis protein [Bacillus sp. FJAT-26390]